MFTDENDPLVLSKYSFRILKSSDALSTVLIVHPSF